jgi:spore maturation protein SpmB
MECDQRVGNYSLVTLLRTGVSLSVTAGLTFSLQRIGTVSVLAACLLFVNIFALTSREKYNVTNVYGSIEVHKRRTDGDH